MFNKLLGPLSLYQKAVTFHTTLMLKAQCNVTVTLMGWTGNAKENTQKIMDQLLCFYLLLIEECISTMSGLPCQETTMLYCHFLTAAQNLELLRVWDLITVMMIMNVNYIARFWVLKDTLMPQVVYKVRSFLSPSVSGCGLCCPLHGYI